MARPSIRSTASGFHLPAANLRKAGAFSPKTGATRSTASPASSPFRSFLTSSAVTPDRSASRLSEIARPRCALPMISETLSSSGIAMKESGEGFELVQAGDSVLRNLLHATGQFHHRVRLAGFLFNRSHRHVGDPTRNDLVERREVAAHIQREPMHGDPMANADADRSDLTILHPNAGQAGARSGRKAAPGQSFHEQIFQPAQI